MRERLVIVGAATPTIIRVVDDINDSGARDIEIVGFLDNAHAKSPSQFYGFSILGGFDAIADFGTDSVVLINTIAGRIADRVKTTEYFTLRGYRFTNIVHPRTSTKYVTMGIGNLVYENATIQPFVKIGNHCVISSNSGIAHATSIADFCFVGPACYICGKVEIEEGVYIGTGAKILPRLKIGKGAQIAASALVNKPVAAGQRIVGIPGRPG